MKNFAKAFVFVLLLNSCTNGTTDKPANDDGSISTLPAPSQITYALLNVYPHDTDAYTQGLQYVNGLLYEGTGNPDSGENISKLRKVDYKTGKVLKETAIKGTLFGEGITVMGDKIYQITWREKKCFVYNLNDFKLIKEFTYNTDGWGLTNDGKYLIMSDGSDKIYFRDPDTFHEITHVSVQDHTGLRNNINELEYINGFIYANVYMTEDVLKIDPSNGHVVGKINFGSLKNDFPELNGPNVDYFNGIAWDSTGNRIFVTGKYWSKLFEVRLN
jgi:glutaminyl-peptide cyclotransferase